MYMMFSSIYPCLYIEGYVLIGSWGRFGRMDILSIGISKSLYENPNAGKLGYWRPALLSFYYLNGTHLFSVGLLLQSNSLRSESIRFLPMRLLIFGKIAQTTRPGRLPCEGGTVHVQYIYPVSKIKIKANRVFCHNCGSFLLFRFDLALGLRVA